MTVLLGGPAQLLLFAAVDLLSSIWTLTIMRRVRTSDLPSP